MVTKKQINTTSKIVVECIEALKLAYKDNLFIGKTEEEKTIIIKFTNKIVYEFPMTDDEYKEYKKLEARLWK